MEDPGVPPGRRLLRCGMARPGVALAPALARSTAGHGAHMAAGGGWVADALLPGVLSDRSAMTALSEAAAAASVVAGGLALALAAPSVRKAAAGSACGSGVWPLLRRRRPPEPPCLQRPSSVHFCVEGGGAAAAPPFFFRPAEACEGLGTYCEGV